MTLNKQEIAQEMIELYNKYRRFTDILINIEKLDNNELLIVKRYLDETIKERGIFEKC